jgi:signal transduction histidine kinase
MTKPTRLTRTLTLAVHEFLTPVTVASGYLRMMLNEQFGPLTSKQREKLEEVDRACRRIGALVKEMSELSRMMSRDLAMARQEIDVAALLAEVASRMHEGADRGVRLEVHADQPAIMTGDRTRISAAIGALVHSALRERGQPGTIVARCSVVQDSDTAWAVVAIGDGSLVGPLTDARHAPPAFDEWHGGVGLSLPLARHVIEAHGGAVWSADGTQSRAASALRLPLRV